MNFPLPSKSAKSNKVLNNQKINNEEFFLRFLLLNCFASNKIKIERKSISIKKTATTTSPKRSVKISRYLMFRIKTTVRA